MTAVQQLGNIDIVRLRDVAGLPTWVGDLTLIAFRPDDTGDTASAGRPSVFVVEEAQDARSPMLGGHDSRIQFIPERHDDKNDPFIRGLLLAADKIRSLE